MKNKKLFIPLLMIFSACSIPRVEYTENLQQLHQNMLTDIMGGSAQFEVAKKYLEEMTETGTWKDIDYTSKERGSWEPASHLSRILSIARAYCTKNSGLYQKKEVSEKIHLALDHWLANDYQCPNWWYPEIGVPKILAPVMILMEAELTPEQFELGFKILDRAKLGMTGQNKIWLAGNVLMTSLLRKDEENIRKAAKAIQEELTVSRKEGVQHDWSYHQHGPQLQFGNYGLSYVNDMIKWIAILRKTPYSFDESKMSILRNYLLEGQQWITWKGQMDISACGRQLFPDSPEGKAASLGRYFEQMEQLDPEFAEDYKKAGDYRNLSGNKHFWRSDIQVQRTPSYYFSVKMCSERVIGAESCNSENVQGYYMGDGATFLYQSNEEYRNIFPFWDWKKIPGTTVVQDNDPLPVLTAQGYRIDSKFVGGASDGKSGIAVLDYNRNGLKAKKSWFMFNDMIVCLGTDISAAKNLPVTTSVNQSFLYGDVIVKTNSGEKVASSDEQLINPLWALHDQVGYLFPNGGKLNLETQNTEGSWHRVLLRAPDERLNKPMFKLWFDHGINPATESYAYILVPQANADKMRSLENQKPFKIFNNSVRQEVISTDGSIAGIVFYRPGSSEVFGGIKTSKACAVMLKNRPDGLEIAIADPSQTLTGLQLTVGGEYIHEDAEVSKGKTLLNIPLPQEEEAGKSVKLVLKKVSRT